MWGCSEFRLLWLIGGCSGAAERGGGVAAPHGGGGRRSRPTGGAVRGGVPPRPPQRPDPLRRAQPGPPGRRPEGKRSLCSLICPVRSRGRCHRVVTVPVVPRAPAGGREHDGGLRAAGRRRGAVGVPVLRERAQLPGGGAGDWPAVLRGLRFGAGPCRSEAGWDTTTWLCLQLQQLVTTPMLSAHTLVEAVTLMCLFCLSGSREGRAPGW